MPVSLAQDNLLVMVQDFCKRQNLPVPTTAFGTTDPQIRQIVALLEEECQDLAQRHAWQSMTFEGNMETAAQENQGGIPSIGGNPDASPAQPGYIKNGGILWDRSTKLPVCGPLDSKDWQALKALAPTGPLYQWHIRNDQFLVEPAPPAGLHWYFEFVAGNWVVDVTGAEVGYKFTADSNYTRLPKGLPLLGLRWRWKKEKGFDYAEDFRTYEERLNTAMARDVPRRSLRADNEPNRGPMPGIYISPYNTVP